MTSLLLALKVFLFSFMSTARKSKTAHRYKIAFFKKKNFKLHSHEYIYDLHSLDSEGNALNDINVIGEVCLM